MVDHLGADNTTRSEAAVLDRLAICAQCEHYTPKRFQPHPRGDGYCDLLTCRRALRGLAAYIARRSSTCPIQRWQHVFQRRKKNHAKP